MPFPKAPPAVGWLLAGLFFFLGTATNFATYLFVHAHYTAMLDAELQRTKSAVVASGLRVVDSLNRVLWIAERQPHHDSIPRWAGVQDGTALCRREPAAPVCRR